MKGSFVVCRETIRMLSLNDGESNGKEHGDEMDTGIILRFINGLRLPKLDVQF